MPDDESIRMMARLIIAPAGGCIRTRQIGKCAAKHRRPPFAPCCHAAFETASQIGITDRAQGDDDLLLIGIRPVIIGRWSGFLNGPDWEISHLSCWDSPSNFSTPPHPCYGSEMGIAERHHAGKRKRSDMKVEEAKYSIAELVEWFQSRVLVVNNEYQRAGSLWPPAAKSYFIDTILKEFPFPKVYFHERLDRDRRPRREIVDGQQRITTLVDFADGKFALGKNASGFEGNHFNDLTEEQQVAFYSYTVSVDVIRNAERADILEMFRRMNAYTLPLNAAEKRHSEFFGEFKDWVNIVLDHYGAMLVDWNILTSRQVVRRADAELISDLALAIEEGIVSTSPAKLLSLYRKYDKTFPSRQEMDERIRGAFDVILSELSELRGTFMTRQHVFHSLVCALIHCRFGLTGVADLTGIPSPGVYFRDRETALISLKRLAAAHEEKELGQFKDYVQAVSEGGNRATQRVIRVRWLCRALLGQLE